MASTATSYNPSRDDFAAMLDESFAGGNLQESSVIKGIVVAIEKDMAVIDVGLKTEGRVALREFAGPGRESDLKVGDEVEVFLDRIENALGEAVLSRDKARREESWGKLEKAFNNNEKVHGVIFNQVKGGFTVDLEGAVAFLPRSQVDIRPIRDVAPLMNNSQPFQILKMDRRRGNIVVSRRTVLEETRAEQRSELIQGLKEGMHTVPTKDRMGLVQLAQEIFAVLGVHRHRVFLLDIPQPTRALELAPRALRRGRRIRGLCGDEGVRAVAVAGVVERTERHRRDRHRADAEQEAAVGRQRQRAHVEVSAGRTGVPSENVGAAQARIEAIGFSAKGHPPRSGWR